MTSLELELPCVCLCDPDAAQFETLVACRWNGEPTDQDFVVVVRSARALEAGARFSVRGALWAVTAITDVGLVARPVAQ